MIAYAEAVMDREELAALESGDGVVVWKSKTDRKEVLEFLKELSHRLEPRLDELVIPYDFHPEFRFKFPILIPGLTGEPTPVFLVGGMDILTASNLTWAEMTQDDGTTIEVFQQSPDTEFGLWDLKATKDKSYAMKTRGQLIFYDLCIELMFGKPASRVGILQPMVDDKYQGVREFVFSADDRMEIMNRMIAMAHARWRGDIDVAPTDSPCFRCDASHACPKYKTPPREMPTIADLMSLTQ